MARTGEEGATYGEDRPPLIHPSCSCPRLTLSRIRPHPPPAHRAHRGLAHSWRTQLNTLNPLS